MPGKRLLYELLRPLRGGWLGPHFYYDLIRIARKGWPTAVRVLFLAVVLVGLLIMDRTQGRSVNFLQPAEFARRAENFAYLLIFLQYVLVLALLPVYVASAIVEEKENHTLEALTLTHLSDRELILGKLGARLMHVGGFALATFPLLAFMHLWGNVSGEMLIYHEVHLFLLLLSAGSACIWTSTTSESVFQAISNSYIYLGMWGLFALASAFSMPPMFGWLLNRSQTDHYWIPLVLLAFGHGLLTIIAVRGSIARMEILRREERKKPRKLTGALTLTDNRPISTRSGKRGQVKSRIHPRAWPIRGHAMFWKECVKDGTDYSLSVRWFFIGAAAVVILGLIFRGLHMVMPRAHASDPGIRALAYTLTFTSYFVALTAYGLAVLFQMTMSVAAEREQGTLTFLLSVPEERFAILFAKWLGPWWRNWPILGIAYLGVLLGWTSGLYGLAGTLFLLGLPWPLFLMMGGIALWLSVLCRRVLLANIAVIAFAGVVVIAHIAVGRPVLLIFAYFLAVLGGTSELALLGGAEPWMAPFLAGGQQTLFLVSAALCIGHAFWMFGRKDYGSI